MSIVASFFAIKSSNTFFFFAKVSYAHSCISFQFISFAILSSSCKYLDSIHTCSQFLSTSIFFSINSIIFIPFNAQVSVVTPSLLLKSSLVVWKLLLAFCQKSCEFIHIFKSKFSNFLKTSLNCSGE
ncbi:MAG: hypothetical protein LBU14_05035 [Candidatus Peribacteria bacterium]|nr:hypothetical protein [Candidatus Peribacteria bacterium]